MINESAIIRGNKSVQPFCWKHQDMMGNSISQSSSKIISQRMGEEYLPNNG